MGQGTYRVFVSKGGLWMVAGEGFMDRDNAEWFGRIISEGAPWRVEWVHPAEG